MTVNTTSATNGPPNLAIDQRSSTQSPKHLPPEFYEHFLSNIARERKPGPSEFFPPCRPMAGKS